MNQIASPAAKSSVIDADPKALLASRKHTLIFLLICVALTIVSAINAAGTSAKDSSSHSQNDMLKLYVFIIGMEWLWVRFVAKGMQDRGRSIFEFLDVKHCTLLALAKDLAIGAIALVAIYFLSTGLDGLTHHDPAAGNAILRTSPSGSLAVTVWICLSLSAGICEEIVFRGYLQRQLTALTGNLGLAIVLQAIIFGIGHAYEGIGSIVNITLHGLVLGLLAAWRRNIRAGMIEHAAWDIIAGLGIMQM